MDRLFLRFDREDGQANSTAGRVAGRAVLEGAGPSAPWNPTETLMGPASIKMLSAGGPEFFVVRMTAARDRPPVSHQSAIRNARTPIFQPSILPNRFLGFPFVFSVSLW
jgi:hypothetical protein